MVLIECDNCERTFEADPAQSEGVGGKVACPYCGDINKILPATASQGDRPTGKPPAHSPESKGLPPDAGPEEQICFVRPAMARAHPFKALLILLIFVGGIVGAVYARKVESMQAWLPYVALVPTLIALLWGLKWWIATHWWVRLEISNKRTVRHEGIITRRTSEVMHDHVRNVAIEQSFLQRILNTGYIGISSSGQDGIEIEVGDIPDPGKVKALIDEYRDM